MQDALSFKKMCTLLGLPWLLKKWHHRNGINVTFQVVFWLKGSCFLNIHHALMNKKIKKLNPLFWVGILFCCLIDISRVHSMHRIGYIAYRTYPKDFEEPYLHYTGQCLLPWVYSSLRTSRIPSGMSWTTDKQQDWHNGDENEEHMPSRFLWFASFGFLSLLCNFVGFSSTVNNDVLCECDVWCCSPILPPLKNTDYRPPFWMKNKKTWSF